MSAAIAGRLCAIRLDWVPADRQVAHARSPAERTTYGTHRERGDPPSRRRRHRELILPPLADCDTAASAAAGGGDQRTWSARGRMAAQVGRVQHSALFYGANSAGIAALKSSISCVIETGVHPWGVADTGALMPRS